VAGVSAESGARVSDLAVEHSVDGRTWSPRGSVALTIDMGKKQVALKFASNTYEMSDSEVAAFKDTVAADAFYKVRIRVEDGSNWMMASTPACSLLASRFRETFRFHIDKAGSLLGFEYSPIVHARGCLASEVPANVKLLSKAGAELPSEAHVVPITAIGGANPQIPAGADPSAIAAAQEAAATKGANGEGAEDEEAKPEPSFLQRYWYIVLPLALLSFFGPTEEPEQKGAGAPAAKGGKKKSK